MRQMRNFKQFLKTKIDWEAFFYKFYELEIYLSALSIQSNQIVIKSNISSSLFIIFI